MTQEAAEEPRSGEELLAAEEVVAGYVPEIDILTGCNLTLAAGEIVGVIGPNGAGKSTLVKALFGLVPIRSGQVRYRGEDITGEESHRLVEQGIGYVPQAANVFPRLTVQENLEMGLYLRPKKFKERFAFVSELFPLLAERRKQRAGSLSGGERQMVALGRALMMNPTVLFLDEPSAGLAPRAVDEVFERVRDMHRAGIAIVIVEQNASRCLQLSDRAYVLDGGANAYTGTGEQLLHDPRVIELYLGTLVQQR
jgi:branched-chain amino acid transport system ATP-binding protein